MTLSTQEVGGPWGSGPAPSTSDTSNFSPGPQDLPASWSQALSQPSQPLPLLDEGGRGPGGPVTYLANNEQLTQHQPCPAQDPGHIFTRTVTHSSWSQGAI